MTLIQLSKHKPVFAHRVPYLFFTHHRQMIELKNNIRYRDVGSLQNLKKLSLCNELNTQCFTLRGRDYLTNITSIISQVLKGTLVDNLNVL